MTVYPYAIVISDGVVMRTIHPPALTERHRGWMQQILREVLFPIEDIKPVAPVVLTGEIIAPSDKPTGEVKAPPELQETLTQAEISRQRGYTGDCCTSCMNFMMKQAGHCLVCESCGTTTGCS